MKKILFIIPFFIMLIMACSASQKHTEMADDSAMMEMPDPVERGRYLTTIMRCHNCHTPKVFGEHGVPMLDSTSFLSGHPAGMPYPEWTPADMEQRHAIVLGGAMLTAWAGPWGVSFTSNLTPDDSTGLGEWTEEAFIQALRTGKHQGQPNGRMILSPMPWEIIRLATDDDLKAIWAYLQSLPAVSNGVPLPIPPPDMPPMEK
ncbi:MAG: diheme cytochrome c-553 [Candidatus Marinimicrobia bacterium]|nr:diheme cytochrome c-553 [Candidatus Neomarinimicrobiota bacterium]